MSQRALASAVKVSPGAVTAWVKNQTAPTNRNLETIVGELGLTMEKFYGRVPKPRAKAA